MNQTLFIQRLLCKKNPNNKQIKEQFVHHDEFIVIPSSLLDLATEGQYNTVMQTQTIKNVIWLQKISNLQ